LFGGLASIARYKGILHDHYLFFLVPAPFFMIGSLLSTVSKRAGKYVALVVVGIVIVLQFKESDVFKIRNYDIPRTQKAVQMVRNEVGSEPFSFTIISSRSFSDLHYRYYMEELGLRPLPITDYSYKTLVLVCDYEDCPTVEELGDLTTVKTLCFEERCKEFYPDIHLKRDWSYIKDEPVIVRGEARGRLYVYRRQ